MDELPDCVCEHMLAMLDQTSRGRCAQLSRRWQQLAMQPLLWRSLRIRGELSVITSELLSRLSVWLSGAVLELHAECLAVNDLVRLLSQSPNLRSLAVIGISGQSPAGEKLLTTLGRFCHRLRRLQLRRCAGELCADSLAQLQAGCPLLSYLELDFCGQVTLDFVSSASFGALAGSLASLSVDLFGAAAGAAARRLALTLPDCARLNSLSLGCSSDSVLLPLLARLPELSELSLRDLPVTDQLAIQIADVTSQGGSLSVLRLSLCHQLTVRGLGALLNACPRLLRLSLSDCRVLSGAGFRLAAARLPACLEELRLDGPAWPGLTEADLAIPLPSSLRLLELRLSRRGGSAGPAGLRLCDALASCPSLMYLTLDICHADLLPALMCQLPRLRCLRLLDCSRLARQSWAELRELRPADLPHLLDLSLLQCSSLTDEAVADLCASPVAKGLRRLCLSPCLQLTAAAIDIIANGFPWLTRLCLGGCRRITDNDFCAVRVAFELRLLKPSDTESEFALQCQ